MEHAKKVILLDPNVYQESPPEKVLSLYRESPSERILSLLDSHIRQILNSAIPEDEKAKQYMMALHRYRKFDADTKPIIDVEKKKDDDILSYVPKPKRSKAKRVLKKISKRVTSTGEIATKTGLVPGSNINDLLDAVLKEKTAQKPIGWNEFGDIVKREGVPDHLFANTEFKKYLNPRSRQTVAAREWINI